MLMGNERRCLKVIGVTSSLKCAMRFSWHRPSDAGAQFCKKVFLFWGEVTMTIRRVVCGLLLLSGTVMAADRYMHPSLGAQGLLQEVRPGCLSNRFYENVLADLTSIVDGGGRCFGIEVLLRNIKKNRWF